MRRVIPVVGFLVVAIVAAAYLRSGVKLATRVELLPAATPYQIILRQVDSLPFQHWDEPF
jgi:hypothetical protein